jgi:flagellar protein FliT
MNARQVIDDYEALLALTHEMRIAAEQGEWDKVLALEPQCKLLTASLKSADELSSPDTASQSHQVELIKKILADDAEIRQRTTAWMSQLQHIMQSNRQEQKINEAYGAM